MNRYILLDLENLWIKFYFVYTLCLMLSMKFFHQSFSGTFSLFSFHKSEESNPISNSSIYYIVAREDGQNKTEDNWLGDSRKKKVGVREQITVKTAGPAKLCGGKGGKHERQFYSTWDGWILLSRGRVEEIQRENGKSQEQWNWVLPSLRESHLMVLPAWKSSVKVTFNVYKNNNCGFKKIFSITIKIG